MRISSSLTNRIFLACTLLAVLSLGIAFYFVNARATREAEAELRRNVEEARTLVDENRLTLTDTFTRMARLVADLPKLKAAVETGDPPTVQPLADDYHTQINADVLVLTGRRGAVLGSVGTAAMSLPASVHETGSAERSTFWFHPHGLLQVVSVPLLLDGDPPEILGRLSVGFFLDDTVAAQLKRLTGSEIAFGAGGRILASTLPPEAGDRLGLLMRTRELASVTIGDEEFLGVSRPLPAAGTVAPGTGPDVPSAIVLRSRTARLRFLDTIRTGLSGALLVTVLLATIVSYGVARTMTRPINAITRAMRDVAATGDLTRKVLLRSRPWDDEDARLLAGAFNTLTESVARFQVEAAQRERLSSLGRLSTVIAHEIRNPLMIIKVSLRTLRNDAVSLAERREAVADIDEETTRLNRIVTEVLDFARPIHFELADANINDVCRASGAAAWASDTPGDASSVEFDLDPTLPPVMTDAERLRTALVNILTNARHAVQAAQHAAQAGLPVTVRTNRPAPAGRASRTLTVVPAGSGVAAAVADEAGVAGALAAITTGVTPDGSSGSASNDAARYNVRVQTRRRGGMVSLSVCDSGIGITLDDLAHIFDPYFTTRRAGTGLGLPIAKNIIEGLGGHIAVTSRRHEGTEIRIDLPLANGTHPGAHA